MSNPFADFERKAFEPERNVVEFEGFDEYSSLSTLEVENVVNSLIPNSHLENCGKISCSEYLPVWEFAPDALAAYNINTREITLADAKTFEKTGENELETLFHEIGHNAQAVLQENNPDAAAQWCQIYEAALERNAYDGFGFVSSYAMVSHFEDFAESYSQYIANPSLLEFMAPEKYAFMRDIVFEGREYGQVITGDGCFSLYEKSLASVLDDALHDAGTDEGNATAETGGMNTPVTDIFRCFSMIG